MKKTMLILSFLCSTMVFAADPPKFKGDSKLEITAPEGKLYQNNLYIFKVNTEGKQVITKTMPKGAVQFHNYTGGAGEMSVVFKATGKITFWSVTAIDSKLVESELVVNVEDGKSPDDNTPPTPDNKPDAALVRTFKSAFALETKANKQEKLTALIESMQYAISECDNQNNSTNKEFTERVQDKTKDKVGDGNLMELRMEIGKYLNKNLPSDKVVDFDSAMKEKHKLEYKKIVQALSAIN